MFQYSIEILGQPTHFLFKLFISFFQLINHVLIIRCLYKDIFLTTFSMRYAATSLQGSFASQPTWLNSQLTTVRGQSFKMWVQSFWHLIVFSISTPIHALYWVVAPLKPVIGGDIFESWVIILAVFAADSAGSLGILQTLKDLNIRTLDEAWAVKTLY